MYTSDTLYTWFDDVQGTPAISVKGAATAGKWAQWDSVMRSRSFFDTLWYDMDESSVKGYFYEDNDFYRLIGRPPNKTLRTYWFNEQDKVTRLLIYWIPDENTPSDSFLKPVAEWARQYHPSELDDLYAHQTIVPSTENAVRWKALLNKYRLFKDSLN